MGVDHNKVEHRSTSSSHVVFSGSQPWWRRCCRASAAYLELARHTLSVAVFLSLTELMLNVHPTPYDCTQIDAARFFMF